MKVFLWRDRPALVTFLFTLLGVPTLVGATLLFVTAGSPHPFADWVGMASNPFRGILGLTLLIVGVGCCRATWTAIEGEIS